MAIPRPYLFMGGGGIPYMPPATKTPAKLDTGKTMVT